MTDRRRRAARRRWADIAIIIAGLYAFFVSLWSPQLVGPGEAAEVVRDEGWWWAGTGAAGTLAIAAVFLALRSAALARVLTGLAGAILLATLFAFERIQWIAWVSVILPAVVLLAAAPFVGPMPSPEEEGHRR